jgi:DNA-binding MarR family transcriptional regulator
LEKRGLVRREPDRRDGRFTNAILTDTGFRYLADAAPGHVEQVRRLVFDVLDDDTQQALRRAAAAIARHLDHDCAASVDACDAVVDGPEEHRGAAGG